MQEDGRLPSPSASGCAGQTPRHSHSESAAACVGRHRRPAAVPLRTGLGAGTEAAAGTGNGREGPLGCSGVQVGAGLPGGRSCSSQGGPTGGRFSSMRWLAPWTVPPPGPLALPGAVVCWAGPSWGLRVCEPAAAPTGDCTTPPNALWPGPHCPALRRAPRCPWVWSFLLQVWTEGCARGVPELREARPRPRSQRPCPPRAWPGPLGPVSRAGLEPDVPSGVLGTSAATAEPS